MSGRLLAIHVAPEAGAPVVPVEHADALAGRGLSGDRYAAGIGSFSRWPGKGRAITLISAADLAHAEAAFGVTVAHGEHRRNLVVDGLDLRALLGGTFRIGGATFHGERVCAPCKYLVRVTGQPAAFDALVGRGGIRAEVVTGGRIAAGDAVALVGEARPRTLPG